MDMWLLFQSCFRILFLIKHTYQGSLLILWNTWFQSRINMWSVTFHLQSFQNN